jgi:glycosyltransferase involved in cell wall biosynthesis
VGDVRRRATFLRRAFDDVDFAIAPSRALRDIFVRNGYPTERLRVFPYGLDTSWVKEVCSRPNDGPLQIGYIGQVEPIKGVDVLVHAFQSLGEVRADLKIFGGLTKNPDFTQHLMALARKNPSIHFMGQFSRSQLAAAFSQIDCVVVPSVWFENAPVVIAEAYAAGKPVICSDLDGMTELVQHEVNGLVFPVGNRGALAGTLHRLIDDPYLLRSLRAGIGPVRTIGEDADALIGIYQELHARGVPGTTLTPR